MNWVKKNQVLLIVFLMLSARYWLMNGVGNEQDVIPFAKQFIFREWIPTDWYMNQSIPYRTLFNFIFGPLCGLFSLEQVTLIGRLWVYFTVGATIQFFANTIKLSAFPTVFAFGLFLKFSSIAAGEWFVQGLDPKGFAYCAILTALMCLIRRNYFWMWAFAGLALSFHVLIGLFAIFSLGISVGVIPELRSDLKKMLRESLPFFVTGIFGLYAFVGHLKGLSSGGSELSTWIYVGFRVPHHVLPSSWDIQQWLPKFLLFLAIPIGVLLYKRADLPLRVVSAFGLGAGLLFTLGLVFHFVGADGLQKYYWFRLADGLLPLLCFFILVKTGLAFFENRKKTFVPILRILFMIFVLGEIGYSAQLFVKRWPRIQDSAWMHSEKDSFYRMSKWIKSETPSDAYFLLDPSIDDFTFFAERASFVTFRNSPQSPKDLEEWYSRLIALNHGKPLRSVGYEAPAELKAAFRSLSKSEFGDLAKEHHLHYILTDQKLDLPLVHSETDLFLYKI